MGRDWAGGTARPLPPEGLLQGRTREYPPATRVRAGKLGGLWAGKAARAAGAGRGARGRSGRRGEQREPGAALPCRGRREKRNREQHRWKSHELPRRLRRCRCPAEGSGRLHWEGTLGFRISLPGPLKTRLGCGFILPPAKLQGTKVKSLVPRRKTTGSWLGTQERRGALRLPRRQQDPGDGNRAMVPMSYYRISSHPFFPAPATLLREIHSPLSLNNTRYHPTQYTRGEGNQQTNKKPQTKTTGTNPGFKSEKPKDHYLWD